MKRRATSLLGVVVLSTGLSTACAADAPSAPTKAQTIRLIIPDWNLRPLGTSCDGAGPYRFAHAEAPFVIKNGAGEEVARGELPTGTSEKIMDIDFNQNVKREPTVCVMLLKVDTPEELEDHLLVIEGRPAVPIKKSDNSDFAGEVVIK